MRRFSIPAILITLIVSFTLASGNAEPDPFRVDIEVLPAGNGDKVLFRANLQDKDPKQRRIIEKYAPYTFSVHDASTLLIQRHPKGDPLIIKARYYKHGRLISTVTGNWPTILLMIDKENIAITGI